MLFNPHSKTVLLIDFEETINTKRLILQRKFCPVFRSKMIKMAKASILYSVQPTDYPMSN